MRVRHHTDDAGLAQIKVSGGIQSARGVYVYQQGVLREFEAGVHVEFEPFATARPGPRGPLREMGCKGEGAFVEFDYPTDREFVTYVCGRRNTAIIPMALSEALLTLADLQPTFVRVRRHFWEIWRTRVR